jgi:colanic acid/amylovoran biosynthesis glycosyltransferase
LLLMLVDPDHNGVPNVVLEAQAVGRPAIIGPVPAAAEALDAGRTGFVLSDAGDLDAIGSILLGLRSHPERLAELGAAARARIESQFDESTHARRLAEILATAHARAGSTNGNPSDA